MVPRNTTVLVISTSYSHSVNLHQNLEKNPKFVVNLLIQI